MRISLTRIEKAVLVGGIILALVGIATRADAARSWASIPPVYQPRPAIFTPASDTPKGLRCPVALHAQGFDVICASVHVREDSVGNLTVRAAGSVSSRDGHRRRVARPLALRVRLIGDKGLRTAPPLLSTRRTRLGPVRYPINRTVQARVVAYVYRGGHWRAYLVNSEPVRIG